MRSDDPRGPVTLLVTLLLITLLAFLPGCAAFRPGVPAQTGADAALLQTCQEPSGSAETNGAIAAWLLAYRGALRACNDQITTFKESSNGRRSSNQ